MQRLARVHHSLRGPARSAGAAGAARHSRQHAHSLALRQKIKHNSTVTVPPTQQESRAGEGGAHARDARCPAAACCPHRGRSAGSSAQPATKSTTSPSRRPSHMLTYTLRACSCGGPCVTLSGSGVARSGVRTACMDRSQAKKAGRRRVVSATASSELHSGAMMSGSPSGTASMRVRARSGPSACRAQACTMSHTNERALCPGTAQHSAVLCTCMARSKATHLPLRLRLLAACLRCTCSRHLLAPRHQQLKMLRR